MKSKEHSECLYGYCVVCDMVQDLVVEDFVCPSCESPLSELSKVEVEKAISECLEDECKGGLRA